MFKNDKDEKKNFLITYKNTKYALDLEAFKRICIPSPNPETIEREITEAYSLDEEDNTQVLSSRINRELKGQSNEMVAYDLIKLLIVRLLDNATIVDKNFEMDFSTALAINTLLDWGILKEIN